MEERMISITVFDADSEEGRSIKSFFAPSVPAQGETFWIDNKSDPMDSTLIEYRVVKRSWVLMVLAGQIGEKRSLHCELYVHRITPGERGGSPDQFTDCLMHTNG